MVSVVEIIGSLSLFHRAIGGLGIATVRFVAGNIRADTGISSHIGTKLRDWADGQAGASYYSRAALSSNDSKTRHLFPEDI